MGHKRVQTVPPSPVGVPMKKQRKARQRPTTPANP